MTEKPLPWYKRAAMWCVLTGAMAIGALILIRNKLRSMVIRRAPLDEEHREIKDQKIKDSIEEIDKEIESVIDGKETIDSGSDIDTVNAQLARARERRRIAALWPRARGAGRDEDDNRSE